MRKDYIILGVYEGHTASACIMINGEVRAAVSEERFSRLKMDMGLPKKSIEYCLNAVGISPREVDKVLLVGDDQYGVEDVIGFILKTTATYSVSDWVKEYNLNGKPKYTVGNDSSSSYRDFLINSGMLENHYYDFSDLSLENPANIALEMKQIRKKAFDKYFGIDPGKIDFIHHYPCHPYYAYYASDLRGSDVLIMHAEGDGGQYNSTIYSASGVGLELLAGTGECDVGRVYHCATLLLGMKPEQHECKVMGLAPYATGKEVEKSYPVFNELFTVDDLLIKYKARPQKPLYFHLRDKFEGHRFDGIAGALQKMTEDILAEWLDVLLKRLKRERVVFGGGVALNIKANKKMAGHPLVRDFFVAPSPSDETTCIGACYFEAEKYCLGNNIPLAYIKPLDNIYLGPSFDNNDILTSINKHQLKNRFKITEGVKKEDLANRLAKNEVVARFCGNMEFGVRALGNRSILGNPSDAEMVKKINDQIKYRDFWMPFCPTILNERQNDYLINPKSLRSPYMTMSFDVTETAKKDIPSALHPADYTTRPQILDKDKNPSYYNLVKAFEKKTGIGALLNTSFNLHGHPIVCTPDDAIYTFLNSELDVLVMEDIMVSRE